MSLLNGSSSMMSTMALKNQSARRATASLGSAAQIRHTGNRINRFRKLT